MKRRWYVEPLNNLTNETIARHLHETQEVETSLQIGEKDVYDRGHIVWEISPDTLAMLLVMLLNSQSGGLFDFHIFFREEDGLLMGFDKEAQVEKWKILVEPFLGRVPDTVLAKLAKVSVSSIRNFRRKQGISAFKKEKK